MNNRRVYTTERNAKNSEELRDRWFIQSSSVADPVKKADDKFSNLSLAPEFNLNHTVIDFVENR